MSGLTTLVVVTIGRLLYTTDLLPVIHVFYILYSAGMSVHCSSGTLSSVRCYVWVCVIWTSFNACVSANVFYWFCYVRFPRGGVRTWGGTFRTFAVKKVTAHKNSTVMTWNSLPNCVVSAGTTGVFKNRLDKFWHDQEIIYDFNAQLEGTGSRSAVE